MIDFTNINYLQHGNTRQQKAYAALVELDIFHLLSEYHPILTGTIPIAIDLAESDLDIICQCDDQLAFSNDLEKHFGHYECFQTSNAINRNQECTSVTFNAHGFSFDIFGQNEVTTQQYAYRHMLIEYQLLFSRGPEFRRQILQLKKQGIKTEAAFAEVLGLEGDPYEVLLELNKIN